MNIIILFQEIEQKMTEIKSPLKRQHSIVSMLSSSPGTQSKLRNKIQIDNLISKFKEFNSRIEVEADQSNFNLFEYERDDDKNRYDPQMMTAKLRQLQNRAEIKRAEMEIQNRRKKRSKKQSSLNQKHQDGYKTIHKKFLKNRKLTNQFEEYHSDDQSNNENEHSPKEVAFYSKLKVHPRLLEFTLSKIHSKNKQEEEKSQKMSRMVENHKRQREFVLGDHKELLEEMQERNNLNLTYNPQSIVDSQSSKFFSKKSSDSVNKDIIMLPRCSKMIEKHNKMLADIDDKSLSKDNKKKLKNRLNQVIMSIGKSQKLSNKHNFPKIQTARTKLS